MLVCTHMYNKKTEKKKKNKLFWKVLFLILVTCNITIIISEYISVQVVSLSTYAPLKRFIKACSKCT